MRIRRDDLVVVTTGDDAVKAPVRVIEVLDGGKKVRIEGVNTVHKHVKRGHPKSPAGGRLSLDQPVDSSNVMLYCGSCSQGVRVGYGFTSDGTKERRCRRCGKSLGTIGAPKLRRATAK